MEQTHQESLCQYVIQQYVIQGTVHMLTGATRIDQTAPILQELYYLSISVYAQFMVDYKL